MPSPVEFKSNRTCCSLSRSWVSMRRRSVMSTNVSTEPMGSPSRSSGYDQYSAGKLDPSRLHMTSLSACTPVPCLNALNIWHSSIGYGSPLGSV